MPRPRQHESEKALDRKAVRMGLAERGWPQAELARRIGKSLAAVNLTINHNTFPDVAARIRRALNLTQ